MDTTDVARAIAAATSVAASLDLPADNAVVLHNSNKLALRLTPCDAFARVAPEGQEVARFEVELARRVAEIASPVGRLEPRADPRVYRRDAGSSATSSRTGGGSARSACVCCARVRPGRRSTR